MEVSILDAPFQVQSSGINVAFSAVGKSVLLNLTFQANPQPQEYGWSFLRGDGYVESIDKEYIQIEVKVSLI